MTRHPQGAEGRIFLAVLGAAAFLSGTFAVLLVSPVSHATRQSVSGAGFLIGGVAVAVSQVAATRRCRGRRRAAWRLFASAAVLALVGNGWSAASGGDPVKHPSMVGQVCVAVALVLCIGGLLRLAGEGQRGTRLTVLILDGFVTACAVLIIAAVVVFPKLSGPTSTPLIHRPEVLSFPLLDLAVATVALMLIVRARADSGFFALVGLGFLLYAVGDLTFAVQSARGTFEVGTLQDMLWIAGYLILAAAAWHPAALTAGDESRWSTTLDVQGTVRVFGLLLGAGAVQLLFAKPALTRTLMVVWLLLILAAAVRQTLLAADNIALRSGLERKVREQTGHLRRVTHETEVMLRSVGDGIYGVDVGGRITFMNPSGALALGYDPKRLLGQHAHDLFHTPAPVDPVVGEDVPCYVTEAIESGAVALSEVDTYVRGDASTFPVEITAAPLVDENRILGAVVVFRDVTQRMEVERMKNEFLSIVSHELRTPLTSIHGSLGLLESGLLGTPDPQVQRMLSIAATSTERLTRLINDILDVERLRSGQLPLNRSEQDVDALLRAAAKEMTGFVDTAGLSLVLTPASGRVLADPDRILQTLTNLLSNAVKFSPRGATVHLGAELRGETEVVFSVSDRGRGIPEDKLESIFEPFEQVDSSDSRRQGGTGLGLAISRGIVERHGGTMWVESRLGEGATLRFTLPRLPDTQPQPAPQAVSARRTG